MVRPGSGDGPLSVRGCPSTVKGLVGEPVRLSHAGQRERVERQHVLSVLRLAVRLDHLAVHDHPRDIYLKRARG